MYRRGGAQPTARRPRLDIDIPMPKSLAAMSLPKNPKNRAFTLIEVLVVISIIALLAGLTISKLDTIFGGSQTEVARLFVTQTMKTPLFAYRINMGGYPSTDEGIQALITAPSNKADRWRGPYIESKAVPVDPWGNAYMYRYPGTHNKDGYDLWSKGKDGVDGADDNIGNW
jgi:general secretion pathway protein G